MFSSCPAFFLSSSTSFNNSFRNTMRVSNSLDPDQDGHFVGLDLGPNCSHQTISKVVTSSTRA